jgi:hypothetical protein
MVAFFPALPCGSSADHPPSPFNAQKNAAYLILNFFRIKIAPPLSLSPILNSQSYLTKNQKITRDRYPESGQIPVLLIAAYCLSVLYLFTSQ